MTGRYKWSQNLWMNGQHWLMAGRIGRPPLGDVRENMAATDYMPALRTDATAWGVSTRISSYPKLLQTSSLRIHSPLSRGSRAETMTLTSTTYQPPSYTHPARGAEGASTRVVLLQLRLGIRAPTQGIFQYNNVSCLLKLKPSATNIIRNATR
jgi:hypothetical protein